MRLSSRRALTTSLYSDLMGWEAGTLLGKIHLLAIDRIHDMSKYCKCKTCKSSPAQPKKGTANTVAEVVEGLLVRLGPADTLVHWSSRPYSQLLSTEIAKIELRGVNPEAVCASFYLYKGITPPRTPPKQLTQLGLAGKVKYVMTRDVANQSSIYLKLKNVPASGVTEVVVVLGCGGHIDFDSDGIATGITRKEAWLR